jgi:lysine-N-methylase
MNRFQCLGGACPDSCCQGWQIHLDQQRYEALRDRMSGSEAEREEFRSNLQRDPRPGCPSHQYAQIRLRPVSGACGFLSPESLCTVQQRYGEAALPDVCSTYPRIVNEMPDRLEVWGALSCPELARLCLLDDDALDLEELTAPLPARLRVAHALGPDATPYQGYLDDIRATVFQLLSMRELPTATRLFLVALLGQQTASFFHRKVTTVDEPRLAAAIEQVTSPETIARWRHELAALPAPQALTAKLVTQLLRERLKTSSGQFRALIEQSLTSYHGAAGAGVDERGSASISVPDLWAAYQQRRETWLGAFADRVDLYLENYAKNFWMREWYASSSDLLAHSHRLLVRVAVLRFLLFSQPSLLAVAGADNLAIKREALDQAAVRVFYQFARAIEHDSAFIDLVAASLVEQGTNTFEHATFLALL